MFNRDELPKRQECQRDGHENDAEYSGNTGEAGMNRDDFKDCADEVPEALPPLPHKLTEYAQINNVPMAKLLFHEYGIHFNTYRVGEHKGELRVLKVRDRDSKVWSDFSKRLGRKLGWLNEHCRIFRDKDDNTVLMFSPYESDEHVRSLDRRVIGDYKCEVRDESIYGFGTLTVVVREAYPDNQRERR